MCKIKYIFCVLIIFIVFSTNAYAADIKSQQLIDNAKKYDGMEITYTGEAIGDIMVRGNYAWVNVNDGDNAIGVWAPESEVKKISFTGSYEYIGDKIRVTGIFHRACKDHGGDFDIHTTSIKVITKGLKKVQPVSNAKKAGAAGLMLLSAVLMLIAYKNHV
jgi:aspartyl/asparaginyl-tRNA synthetase